ncbi:unnamed protein product [Gadus morhua 'NCC']
MSLKWWIPASSVRSLVKEKSSQLHKIVQYNGVLLPEEKCHSGCLCGGCGRSSVCAPFVRVPPSLLDSLLACLHCLSQFN